MPRRVARSARLGNALNRGQILPCKRSRWGNLPSRGLIRETSNSCKIHFGGGFVSLLKVTTESNRTDEPLRMSAWEATKRVVCQHFSCLHAHRPLNNLKKVHPGMAGL